jgi:opacity protein-like surface antigen
MKKISKKLILFSILAFNINNVLQAQVQEGKKYNSGFAVGVNASHLYEFRMASYDQLESGFLVEGTRGMYGDKTAFDLGYGLDLSYFISSKWNMELYYQNASMTGANEIEFYKANMNLFGIAFNYDIFSFTQNQEQNLVPYVRASLSYLQFDSERRFVFDESLQSERDGNTWMVGLGAGLRYHITDQIQINLHTEYSRAFNDAITGWDYGKARTNLLRTTLGLKYTFGKGKHINRQRANTLLGLTEKLDELERTVGLSKTGQVTTPKPTQNQTTIPQTTTSNESVENLKEQLALNNQSLETIIEELNSLKVRQAELEKTFNEKNKNNSVITTTNLVSKDEPTIAQAPSVKTKTNIEGIYAGVLFFNQNQHNLSVDHQKELIKIIAFAQFNNAKIQISSFPKANNNTDTSVEVWDKRYQAVKSFLIKNGINESKISNINWDFNETNLSPELNRRVDIVVIPSK